MRKRFVVPVLREEAKLAQITLGPQVISTGGGFCPECQDGID